MRNILPGLPGETHGKECANKLGHTHERVGIRFALLGAFAMYSQ